MQASLAENAVTADALATGAVTAEKIAGNTITLDKLALSEALLSSLEQLSDAACGNGFNLCVLSYNGDGTFSWTDVDTTKEM